MRKTMVLGALAFSLMFLTSGGYAADVAPPPNVTHLKVSGVVSKVQSGLITIKTSWGSMSIASNVAPKHLAVGEEVDMQVSGNNAVIDVHRKGDPAHAHRFVSGSLTYTSSDHKEIKLWTPEG